MMAFYDQRSSVTPPVHIFLVQLLLRSAFHDKWTNMQTSYPCHFNILERAYHISSFQNFDDIYTLAFIMNLACILINDSSKDD